MNDLTSTRLGVLLAAVVTAMAVASVGAMEQDAPRGADQRPQAEPTSLCSAFPRKSAAPVDAVLGEPVTVTTHVTARCSGIRPTNHFVLVLDGSETLSLDASRRAKALAERVVLTVQLGARPAAKIGVVEFGETTSTLCRPTNDESRVLNCIRRVGRSGEASLDEGLTEGIKALNAARADVLPQFHGEAMIVVTDAQVEDGCRSARAAARQARSNGILVATACVSRHCDYRCTESVASGPRYGFRYREHGLLLKMLGRFFDRIIKINLRRLAVRDHLSDLVKYDERSALPAPANPVSDGRIDWVEVYIPAGGVTFTHRVIPIATGEIPTSQDASGTMLDNLGRTTEFNFEIPIITVREPTATVAPTASPTATPTPPPTATATPTAVPVYLPRVVRGG